MDAFVLLERIAQHLKQSVPSRLLLAKQLLQSLEQRMMGVKSDSLKNTSFRWGFCHFRTPVYAGSARLRLVFTCVQSR